MFGKILSGMMVSFVVDCLNHGLGLVELMIVAIGKIVVVGIVETVPASSTR